MAKCPSCRREINSSEKSWKYAQFTVQVYSCNCGTVFREYAKEGKHRFTLKHASKNKGWVKA